jgi:hypothetical protein
MTGFLTRLAERSLSAESVRPRPVSLFEPVGAESDGDVVTVTPPPSNGRHPSPTADPVAAEQRPVSDGRAVPADARASPDAPQPPPEASRPSPRLEPTLERERAATPEQAPTESQPPVPETALVPRERTDAERETAEVFEPSEPAHPPDRAAPAARPPRTQARIVPNAEDGRRVRANRGRPTETAAATPRLTERAAVKQAGDRSGHVSSPQRLAFPDLSSVVAKRASGTLADGLRSPLVAAEPPEPVVHVSIGRVEIRAQETPASRPTRERASRPPALSLSEYLHRRAREAAQ